MKHDTGGCCAGRIMITGVLAVLPIDGFTGKPICRSDFLTEVQGVQAPVRKRDGFFVFPGALPEPEKENGAVLTVRLAGQGFQEACLHIPAASVRREQPVLTVRMKPDRDYPFGPHTLFLEGRLAEGIRLTAAPLQRAGSLRLSQDYHAGEKTIAVYGGAEKNLTGSTYYLAEEGPHRSGGKPSDPGEIQGGGKPSDPGEIQGGGKPSDPEETQYGEGRVSDSRMRRGDWITLDARDEVRPDGYRLRSGAAQDFSKSAARLFPAAVQEESNLPQHYFFAFPGNGESEGGGKKGSVEVLCRTQKQEDGKEYRFLLSEGEPCVRDFL